MSSESPANAPVRAFVGCPLDAPTAGRLAALAAATRARLELARWRAAWVPPANLHVTIKFLGEVDPARLPALAAALAGVARVHAPIAVHVAGLGAFPLRGAPRVLFAQLARGEQALAALARDVDVALAACGARPEARAFHAHVTLARLKPPWPPRAALAELASSGADCGEGTLTELVLFQSELTKRGASYRALARCPLTATG